MPTARELLEQADALMRRNRARQVDTEIPELTEVVEIPVAMSARPSPPIALADIPELTDAVEEIEIASIVELPDDDVEPGGWLRSDRAAPGASPDVTPDESASQAPRTIEPIGGRVLPLFAIAPAPRDDKAPAIADDKAPAIADDKEPVIADDKEPVATDDKVSVPAPAPSPEAEVVSIDAAKTAVGADWARWEALAEEIRMQVLQRIDIFTDTGLREQLSVQMQPIVDRASAEMVATINEQVGRLLRAYIAEAIEREIEKWRKGNS